MVQGISQFIAVIRGNVTISLQFSHVHVPELMDQLACSVFPAKPQIQITVYDQSDETGHEMRFYPVIILQVSGTGFKFMFHDPKTFLDLPPSLIDPDDLLCIILQVGADSIEPVKAFFLSDPCLV